MDNNTHREIPTEATICPGKDSTAEKTPSETYRLAYCTKEKAAEQGRNRETRVGTIGRRQCIGHSGKGKEKILGGLRYSLPSGWNCSLLYRPRGVFHFFFTAQKTSTSCCNSSRCIHKLQDHASFVPGGLYGTYGNSHLSRRWPPTNDLCP